MLTRTRASFYYVFGYLAMAGLGFFLLPELSLRLFLSNGEYDPVFMRISGALLIVLAAFVLQIVRHRLEALYLTVIYVRAFLLIVWALLYFATRDLMFIGFFVIVGVGFLLSIFGYRRDKRA